MQDSDDSNAVIGDAIEDDPTVERRRHNEKSQVAEFLRAESRARSHFWKIAEQIKRLKRCIQKRASRNIIIAPDEIPPFDQVFIHFGGCLPFHGFKSP